MAFPLPSQFKALISDPTAKLCGNFLSTLVQFPRLFYTFYTMVVDADGNLTDVFSRLISDITLRPGDLILSAAPADTNGRLLCNGALVSRTTYAALYAKIGDTYGAGDGSTTFQLPDFRDRFPKGAGNVALAVTTDGNLTLNSDQLPAHPHLSPFIADTVPGDASTLAWEDLGSGNEAVAGSGRTVGASGSTVAAGSRVHPYTKVNTWTAGKTVNDPLNIVPASVAVFYYVKT